VQDQSNGGPVVASYEPDFRRRLAHDGTGRTPLERLGYVMSDEYIMSIDRRSHAETQERHDATRDENVRGQDGGRDERALQNKVQVVSMERCFFMNCSQGDYADLPPTYGVVSSITTYNALVLNDCIFSDNVYDGVRRGSARKVFLFLLLRSAAP
jgi:hypothetical protein